jgi:flavin-dependent dehydrogenase
MTAKPGPRADVVIIGGGMAGLTLALQLRQENPDLDIRVLERSVLPPPAATHKVGESTVEIGSWYLDRTLGLGDMLERRQLRKFGLRFFFGAGAVDDLAAADELGASSLLPVRSFQLDRGIFESDLAELAVERGITVTSRATVRRVEEDTAAGGWRVDYRLDDGEARLGCRWVIDASSRASILKRQFGLALDSPHKVNAAWFRIDGVIDIDGMSSRSAWHERISGMPRRMSTNHFMGPGYWIWFIPLPGDRTSVGIVADPALHPFEALRDYDSCLAWLAREQPLCAQALAASGDAPMDFRYLRGFSHDCKRLWSSEGWGLTGEAGVFADPFYSPGADFIALSNTFLTEIVGRSLRGHNVRAPALIYEQLYKSFYWTSMSIYQGQYPGFGDSRLMALKSTWDYAYYWGVLALLYVSGGMTDLDTMRRLEPTLVGLQKMHRDMQSEFRAVAARGVQSPGQGRFFDQRAIPILLQLNGELEDGSEPVTARIRHNAERLERLDAIVRSQLKTPAAVHDCELLGDLGARLS